MQRVAHTMHTGIVAKLDKVKDEVQECFKYRLREMKHRHSEMKERSVGRENHASSSTQARLDWKLQKTRSRYYLH
jgi:hypothetical protein